MLALDESERFRWFQQNIFNFSSKLKLKGKKRNWKVVFDRLQSFQRLILPTKMLACQSLSIVFIKSNLAQSFDVYVFDSSDKLNLRHVIFPLITNRTLHEIENY
ncbi:hypothetical protein ACH3XW_35260 [Acanthocheilonema viteae]